MKTLNKYQKQEAGLEETIDTRCHSTGGCVHIYVYSISAGCTWLNGIINDVINEQFILLLFKSKW